MADGQYNAYSIDRGRRFRDRSFHIDSAATQARPLGPEVEAKRAEVSRVRIYCAFNVTRQSFVSLGVAIADTPLSRLRGLLGKMRIRSDEAVWIVPSRGIHTFGLRFAIDVIYLDGQQRVVHIKENMGPLRVAPLRWQCESVLELPPGCVSGSGTQTGDQLLICSAEEMTDYLARQRSTNTEAASIEEGRRSNTVILKPAI